MFQKQIDVSSFEKLEKFAQYFVSSIIEIDTIYFLMGNIGVGKTTFLSYLAKELGVDGEVNSPSFNLVNEYHSNNYTLYHMDLFRLQQESNPNLEFLLNDYLDSYSQNNVLFIEWPNAISFNWNSYLRNYDFSGFTLTWYVDIEKKTRMIQLHNEFVNTDLNCSYYAL